MDSRFGLWKEQLDAERNILEACFHAARNFIRTKKRGECSLDSVFAHLKENNRKYKIGLPLYLECKRKSDEAWDEYQRGIESAPEDVPDLYKAVPFVYGTTPIGGITDGTALARDIEDALVGLAEVESIAQMSIGDINSTAKRVLLVVEYGAHLLARGKGKGGFERAGAGLKASRIVSAVAREFFLVLPDGSGGAGGKTWDRLDGAMKDPNIERIRWGGESPEGGADVGADRALRMVAHRWGRDGFWGFKDDFVVEDVVAGGGGDGNGDGAPPSPAEPRGLAHYLSLRYQLRALKASAGEGASDRRRECIDGMQAYDRRTIPMERYTQAVSLLASLKAGGGAALSKEEEAYMVVEATRIKEEYEDLNKRRPVEPASAWEGPDDMFRHGWPAEPDQVDGLMDLHYLNGDGGPDVPNIMTLYIGFTSKDIDEDWRDRNTRRAQGSMIVPEGVHGKKRSPASEVERLVQPRESVLAFLLKAASVLVADEETPLRDLAEAPMVVGRGQGFVVADEETPIRDLAEAPMVVGRYPWAIHELGVAWNAFHHQGRGGNKPLAVNCGGAALYLSRLCRLLCTMRLLGDELEKFKRGVRALNFYKMKFVGESSSEGDDLSDKDIVRGVLATMAVVIIGCERATAILDRGGRLYGKRRAEPLILAVSEAILARVSNARARLTMRLYVVRKDLLLIYDDIMGILLGKKRDDLGLKLEEMTDAVGRYPMLYSRAWEKEKELASTYRGWTPAINHDYVRDFNKIMTPGEVDEVLGWRFTDAAYTGVAINYRYMGDWQGVVGEEDARDLNHAALILERRRRAQTNKLEGTDDDMIRREQVEWVAFRRRMEGRLAKARSGGANVVDEREGGELPWKLRESTRSSVGRYAHLAAPGQDAKNVRSMFVSQIWWAEDQGRDHHRWARGEDITKWGGYASCFVGGFTNGASGSGAADAAAETVGEAVEGGVGEGAADAAAGTVGEAAEGGVGGGAAADRFSSSAKLVIQLTSQSVTTLDSLSWALETLVHAMCGDFGVRLSTPAIDDAGVIAFESGVAWKWSCWERDGEGGGGGGGGKVRRRDAIEAGSFDAAIAAIVGFVEPSTAQLIQRSLECCRAVEVAWARWGLDARPRGGVGGSSMWTVGLGGPGEYGGAGPPLWDDSTPHALVTFRDAFRAVGDFHQAISEELYRLAAQVRDNLVFRNFTQEVEITYPIPTPHGGAGAGEDAAMMMEGGGGGDAGAGRYRTDKTYCAPISHRRGRWKFDPAASGVNKKLARGVAVQICDGIEGAQELIGFVLKCSVRLREVFVDAKLEPRSDDERQLEGAMSMLRKTAQDRVYGSLRLQNPDLIAALTIDKDATADKMEDAAADKMEDAAADEREDAAAQLRGALGDEWLDICDYMTGDATAVVMRLCRGIRKEKFALFDIDDRVGYEATKRGGDQTRLIAYQMELARKRGWDITGPLRYNDPRHYLVFDCVEAMERLRGLAHAADLGALCRRHLRRKYDGEEGGLKKKKRKAPNVDTKKDRKKKDKKKKEEGAMMESLTAMLGRVLYIR